MSAALQTCIRRANRAPTRAARARLRVVHFSVQGDHIHLLVEAVDGAALAAGAKGLAVRFARAINRVTRRRGQVWADRYHRRDLASPTEVRNALLYVLNNHKKHGRHDGREGRLDPHSSAQWFDGWQQRPLAALTTRAGPDEEPPCSPPATWLLRIGWRRRGLIDPRAIPGPRR